MKPHKSAAPKYVTDLDMTTIWIFHLLQGEGCF